MSYGGYGGRGGGGYGGGYDRHERGGDRGDRNGYGGGGYSNGYVLTSMFPGSHPCGFVGLLGYPDSLCRRLSSCPYALSTLEGIRH